MIVLVAAAAALSTPAQANLRLARKVDGVFSGNLKTVAAASELRLIAEYLDAAFPDLDLSTLSPKDTIRFKAVYEIENRANQALSVPVRFIAVDIRDISAELNGRALVVRNRDAPEEKKECLIRIARHRAGFLPGFYEDFLHRLRSRAGLDQEPEDHWLQKLEEQDLRSRPAESSFLRTLESPPEMDFPSAEFELVLPPGRSRLAVTYGQRLFIDERGNGYFAAWPKKGVTGFDYLLYPAKTWNIAPEFRLHLSVRMPDARNKTLFFRTWKRPEIKCSLPLQEESGGEKRVRILRGEFAGLPADILTFLFWFDKKAADYVR
jgi:hypothetical protein